MGRVEIRISWVERCGRWNFYIRNPKNKSSKKKSKGEKVAVFISSEVMKKTRTFEIKMPFS